MYCEKSNTKILTIRCLTQNRVKLRKKVTLGNKVLDGDVLYLQNIPEYGFVNFPHYNLKHKQ